MPRLAKIGGVTRATRKKYIQVAEKLLNRVSSLNEYANHRHAHARKLSTAMDMACLRERPAFDRFSTDLEPVVEKRAINDLKVESCNVSQLVRLSSLDNFCQSRSETGRTDRGSSIRCHENNSHKLVQQMGGNSHKNKAITYKN